MPATAPPLSFGPLKRAAYRLMFCRAGVRRNCRRSLTRLHMSQTGYPLHVMHGYVIPASEAVEFSLLVRRVDPETLSKIETVNAARRPLLAYAALVMEHVVRIARPQRIVVSALGVREGRLFDKLGDAEKKRDPLLAAAQELNVLRSRSP